jgi:hypothetical protein
MEAPAVESLPTTEEFSSFADALDSAFAKLDSAAVPAAEPQAPADPPQDTPADEPTKPSSEPQDEPEGADPDEDSAEEPQDDLEALSEEGDWTPKAAKRFKQLKEELKGSRSELERLRQISKEQELKINEMSGLVENKDIEQLQSKIAEYEQDQMFRDLENTTAYREAVSEPLAQLMAQADQIADKYDIDANALIDVIALADSGLQDERLSELLPHASDRDKARVFRIIEDVAPILARRTKLYENVEEATREAALLEETRQKQDLAERARLRENVTRNVVDRIAEKLPFVKALDGLDLDAIRNKASGMDPSVIHPVDFAYNAVSAQILPSIVREYVGLRKEVEALTDKLAEFENAEPKMSGAAGGSRSGSGSGSGFEGNFIDAINRAFGG